MDTSSTGSNWTKLLLLPFLVGLVFSHKLSVFITFVTLLMAIVVAFINRLTIAGYGHGSSYQKYEQNRRLFTMIALLLAVQVVFVTQWIKSIVITAILPLLRLSLAPGGDHSQVYQAATAAPGSLLGRAIPQIYWPILLAVAALAAIFLWQRDDSITLAVVLGGVATTAVFASLAFISSEGASVRRVLLYGEPVLIIVIAVAITVTYHHTTQQNRGNRSSRVAHLSTVLIICLLIIAQTGAADIVPDYPDEPRYYLNSNEVAGKEFGMFSVPGTITTDSYYAGETVVFGYGSLDERNRDVGDTPGFHGNDTMLLNGSDAVAANNWTYLAYRTDVDVYAMEPGNYRLNWTPTNWLNKSSNRIYSNGDVDLFARINTDSTV